jgi:hypothetical protein
MMFSESCHPSRLPCRGGCLLIVLRLREALVGEVLA